jgi:hypothetical protein
MSVSTFDASESALGFAYQERQALLIAVRRAYESPAHEMSIETLDDVGLASIEGTTVWQVKNTATPITNAAADLWKTIRVWCEHVAMGILNAADTTFVLLAASKASPGSAAAFLRNDGRDVAAAISLLQKTADTSSNDALEAAFNAFKALSDAKKTELFSNVFVVDGSPGIVEVRRLIEYEVRWAFAPSRRDAFLDRLEGWWRRTVIDLLLKSGRKSLPLGLIGSEIQTLRREMEESSLPIDFEDALPTEEEKEGFMGKTFVRQLQIVGLNRSVIHAIVDYYRAGLQRNRWIGDALLYTEQLDSYSVRLQEEWRAQCDAMLDDLGEGAAEAEKQKLGRELYEWMRERSQARIVPECGAPFVRRGSYQILADGKKIGWHPDFELRLAEAIVEALH